MKSKQTLIVASVLTLNLFAAVSCATTAHEPCLDQAKAAAEGVSFDVAACEEAQELRREREAERRIRRLEKQFLRGEGRG